MKEDNKKKKKAEKEGNNMEEDIQSRLIVHILSHPPMRAHRALVSLWARAPHPLGIVSFGPFFSRRKSALLLCISSLWKRTRVHGNFESGEATKSKASSSYARAEIPAPGLVSVLDINGSNGGEQ